jgi:hypothetical protein
MGPAGKEFVYKKEIRQLRQTAKTRLVERARELVRDGASEASALKQAEVEMDVWIREQEAVFSARYEKELMNPKEALSLGSISHLVMPTDLRFQLAQSLEFLLRTYTPGPMSGVQREFH